MNTDLLAKLREEALALSSKAWNSRCGGPDCGIASNLANEAADAIDSLESEVKALQRDNLSFEAAIEADGRRIAELERERDEARVERDVFKDAMFDEAKRDLVITDIAVRGGGFFAAFEGGPCKVFADGFGDMLLEAKAPNYIEAQFRSAKLGPDEMVTVTVQKVSGKTPHQLRVEAERDLQAAMGDAKRYQFMRSHGTQMCIDAFAIFASDYARNGRVMGSRVNSPEEIDATCDTAMETTKS